jgi:hypothetical protein
MIPILLQAALEKAQNDAQFIIRIADPPPSGLTPIFDLPILLLPPIDYPIDYQ